MSTPEVHDTFAAWAGPPPGLAEEAICLALTLKKPNQRLRVDPEDIPELDSNLPLHVTVDLFKSPRLREMARLDNAIRAFVRSVSVPFPLQKGYYLVPVALRLKVSRELNELFAKRDEIKEEFLGHYEDVKNASRDLLEPLLAEKRFERCFPSRGTLEAAFKAEKRYVPVQNYLDHLWTESTEQIREFLRKEFLQMVESFAKHVGRKRNEKTYRERAERIIDFLATFEHRNVLDDEELAALTKRVRDMFAEAGGVAGFAKKAHEDDDFRDDFKSDLNDVSDDIRRGITIRPTTIH